ncbi:MAG: hypothetical protein IPH59_05535 [bacterium]|nr:hypothetical protein [bacterium]
MKSPEQIMAQMYKSALVIMILLLISASVASFFDISIQNLPVSALAIKFYLLVIPAVLMAFTITMFVRRVMNLAIAGLILSLLWLIFKWIG